MRISYWSSDVCSSDLEQRHALDMARMRKHVHHTRTRQRVPEFMPQHARIPRQRTRMARHINNPLRLALGDDRQDLLGTGAWRIEPQIFKVRLNPVFLTGFGAQIGLLETDSAPLCPPV